MSRAAAVLFLLLVPFHALAGDGVLEINQACVAQGCFPGDPPGLPVEITTAGSYRLTSNIALPDLFSGALFIQADNVTIDLNGFEIRGVNTCSFINGDLSCGTTLVGHAIFAPNNVVRTEVRNGSVTAAGGTGVRLGDESTVRDLRVSWNGLGGISVRNRGVVRNCAVYQNHSGESSGVAGIEAAGGARIEGNSSYQNRGDGIDVTGDGSFVHDNLVYENDEHGISVGFTTSVQRNTVYHNDVDGINAFGGSKISGNNVSSNGFDGIAIASALSIGGAVSDNTVNGNGGSAPPGQGVGLNLVDHTTYSGNTVVGNVTNQVVGGVNRGGNYCAGTGVASADCP